MQNKFLKVIKMLIFSIVIFTGMICCYNSIMAKTEIIPSPTGNILKIHNEKIGGLYNELQRRFKYDYRHIVVTGKLNESDLGFLNLAVYNCVSIDIHDTEIAGGIISMLFYDKPNLEKFVCPRYLKIIGRNCFTGCHKLKIFILPEALEFIEKGAFQFCGELELILPEKIRIGKKTFCGCPKVVLQASHLAQQGIYVEDKSIPSIWDWLKSFF